MSEWPRSHLLFGLDLGDLGLQCEHSQRIWQKGEKEPQRPIVYWDSWFMEREQMSDHWWAAAVRGRERLGTEEKLTRIKTQQEHIKHQQVTGINWQGNLGNLNKFSLEGNITNLSKNPEAQASGRGLVTNKSILWRWCICIGVLWEVVGHSLNRSQKNSSSQVEWESSKKCTTKESIFEHTLGNDSCKDGATWRFRKFPRT